MVPALIHRQLAIVAILQCGVKYCEESIIDHGNSAKNFKKCLACSFHADSPTLCWFEMTLYGCIMHCQIKTIQVL